MVRRYKTAQFKGYFLGARAVLEILFKLAPGMESGRKNEGFILYLFMQFKDEPVFQLNQENLIVLANEKTPFNLLSHDDIQENLIITNNLERYCQRIPTTTL